MLEFVGEINDAQDLDELRTMVLPLLRRLVPADYSSYNEVPSDGGPMIAITEPELSKTVHEAWGRLAHTNPLVARMVRTRDGRPWRFSDVVSQAELREMPIYRELYRPLGIEHQIAFALPAPASITIGVALSRGGRLDFTDTEREMLGVIRPHLIQAYRNAQLRLRTANLMGLLREGLDAHGDAVLITDSDGVVVLSTAFGRKLAGEIAGTAVREGHPLPPAVAALARRDKPGAPVPTATGEALLVQHVAAGDRSVALFLARARRVLSPGTLEGLGLTAREAAVLAAFAGGRSTDEAAAELGITRRTVLKHAERVHRKLGVGDRAQAIATAWAATEAASATRAGAAAPRPEASSAERR